MLNFRQRINYWARTIKSEARSQKELDRKSIALEFFKLVGSGKFKEGVRKLTCLTQVERSNKIQIILLLKREYGFMKIQSRLLDPI